MKRYLLSFLMSVLLIGNSLLSIVLPAYAATTNLTVNGDGTKSAGLYYPSGTWANMNTDDGDTLYWNLTVVANPKTWAFTNPGLPAGSIIDSVTVYAKMKTVGSANTGTIMYYNGIASYYGNTETLTASYVLYSKMWTTNPATGVAWTESQVNAAEFGVNASAVGSGTSCTYIYVVVAYTPPAVPTVTTDDADDLTSDSATLNGTIDDDGGTTITNYGFVWDTTSRGNPGNTAPTASAYTNSWEVGAGTYSEGAIDHATGATLVSGLAYYARAAAYNSEGWSYGDEEVFYTIDTATISTLAAINISVSTARLRAYLSDDGGEDCEVRWGYGESDEGNNIEDYDTYTSFAGAYRSEENPYLDIDSLSAGTTYYFNVEVQNDAGTSTGSSLSFTTESSVGTPSNVTAIPRTNSIVVSWTKGTGAPNTYIRIKANSCPEDETDGTLIYMGTGSTTTITNLVSGNDYCLYLVGYDSVEGYSSGHVIIHATTLAEGIVIDVDSSAVDKPSSGMTATPNIPATIVENIPLIPVIEDIHESTEIPTGTLAYFIVLIVLTGLSYYIYRFHHSIEAIVIIWVVVSWPTYLVLDTPVIVPIFVTLVGLGYGALKMRSLI